MAIEKRNKNSELVGSTSSATTSTTTTAEAMASPTATFFLNETAIRNNFNVLEFSRTCQAAASGMASGIFGLTGIYGFLFYFVCIFLQTLCWEYKAGFQWEKFFTNRWLSVNYSIVNGLFTYVLFWVFIYGMVHVY